MAAPPRSAGAKRGLQARHSRMVPTRLTSSVWRKRSISNSAPPRWMMPAQFTRPARSPSMPASAASTEAASVTSSFSVVTPSVGGKAAISASDTVPAKTRQPPAASARETPAPMPLVPPVTT
jgi:hypothetical protein